ncbi:MAG TPA: hypothetical protein VIH42_05990 [Thermoguttaceae bacterium]
MVERNGGAVRAVAWSEICSWLSIFRTFRLAIGFRVLLMGAVGILLTTTGWGLLGNMFSITQDNAPATNWLRPYVECPWIELTMLVPDQPIILSNSQQMDVSQTLGMETQPRDPVFFPMHFLNQPLREGLVAEINLKYLICLILCGLWSMAVWAFFGAAICRIAAVQLAASERISWFSAIRHAVTKYLSYFSAPLIPLTGAALAAVPIAVVGLIMYLGNFGVFVGALAWPIALVFGLIITLLFLGLIFGWPLMWGTISTEGTDSFDALSRSYAYVFQAPLHYLFYAFVAAVLGALGWILVQNFAAGVIWLTYWSASWGATDLKIQAVMPGGEIGGIGYAGAWLIRFWTGCVKILAVGYLFSYFWTASVAIYLLMRRVVDATEMDEVFLDADEGEKVSGLPKIVTDESGAPKVSEESSGA